MRSPRLGAFPRSRPTGGEGLGFSRPTPIMTRADTFSSRLPARAVSHGVARSSLIPSDLARFAPRMRKRCSMQPNPSLGDTRPSSHLPRAVFRSWSPGISGREVVSRNGRISCVPGEPRLCSCPALRPRWDRRILPSRCVSARPPLCPRRRLPHSYFRGPITRLRHWPSTLRSASYPYTTQDLLPAVGQTLPDGLLPEGFQRKVSRRILHPILLSQVKRGARTQYRIAVVCR